MLRAMGYQDISTFHLNEGHAALLTLALLDEAAKQAGRESVVQRDMESVRNLCVFTTHTPVPAGHDKFSLELARNVIGERDDFFGLEGVLYEGDTLNMTCLGLNLSRYVNGVARKQGEVSRLMFALGEKLGFQVKTRPDVQEFELVIPLAHSEGGVSHARQQT